MKYRFLLTSFLTLIFFSCEKEQNRKLLDAYFKYTVDGTETVIKDGSGLNNNVFNCTIEGDTALIIRASKLYENVGFFVYSDSIVDGTYALDSKNKGYFTHPVTGKRYTTNDTYKGTLTIQKKVFEAKSMLNTVEGQFSFVGEDTLTGKTYTVTNGSFLMERKE